MLRINKLRAAIAVLAVILLTVGETPVMALENEDLYFDALEETYTVKVDTTKVTRGDFYVNSSCKAYLNYDNVYYCYNEITYGKVTFEQFLVNSGYYVNKGDPIATVNVEVEATDLSELLNKIDLKEKNLEEYDDANNALLMEYDRIANGSGSAEEKRTAKLLHDRLEVTYSKERKNRERELDDLYNRYNNYESVNSQETITAPGTGYVVNINRYRRGDTLNGYSYLCAIVDPEYVRVFVYGGNDLLRYNMDVTVTQGSGASMVSAPGVVTTNRSTTLSTSLVGNDDVIVFTGDCSQFDIGQEVIVKFRSVDMKNVLTVSKKAVYTDDKGSYVFLYKDGFSQKQYILTGGANSESVYVVDGLSEGDNVVIK